MHGCGTHFKCKGGALYILISSYIIELNSKWLYLLGFVWL